MRAFLMQMLTWTLRVSCVLALMGVAGCGGSEPEPTEPEVRTPVVTEPTGPVAPEHGLMRIRVVSRETLPSLQAPEPTAMTQDEMFGAVQPLLVTHELLADSPEALVCEALTGTDRVRFWIARDAGIEEEQCVALAQALAESFIEQAEARFQDRVAVALMGLEKELEAASIQRNAMQQTLRDYLDINQARSATADTRREQRELERDFDRLNAKVGEISSLRDRLARMQEKGQPWYRLVE